jgi:hypothetical protein
MSLYYSIVEHLVFSESVGFIQFLYYLLNNEVQCDSAIDAFSMH